MRDEKKTPTGDADVFKSLSWQEYYQKSPDDTGSPVLHSRAVSDDRPGFIVALFVVF